MSRIRRLFVHVLVLIIILTGTLFPTSVLASDFNQNVWSFTDNQNGRRLWIGPIDYDRASKWHFNLHYQFHPQGTDIRNYHLNYVGYFSDQDIRRLSDNECFPGVEPDGNAAFVWRTWDQSVGTRYVQVRAPRNTPTPAQRRDAAQVAAYEFLARFNLDQRGDNAYFRVEQELAVGGISALTNNLYALTNHPNTVDLALVIDNTGSMGSSIDAVKANATTLVRSMACTAGARIAIVTYNDPEAWVVQPFTNDFNAVITAINSIDVGGGGDTPEAVYNGIMTAIGLDWKTTNENTIIVMGDAPPKDPEPGTGYTQASVIAAAQSGVISLGQNPASAPASTPDGPTEAPPTDEPQLPPADGQSGPSPAPPVVAPDVSNVTIPSDTEPSTEATDSTIVPEVGIKISSVAIGNDAAMLSAFNALATATGGQVRQAVNAADVAEALSQLIVLAETGLLPWKQEISWYGGNGTMRGVVRPSHYSVLSNACAPNSGSQHVFFFTIPSEVAPNTLRWWARNVVVDQAMIGQYGPVVAGSGDQTSPAVAWLCFPNNGPLPVTVQTLLNELRLSW